MNAHRQGAPLQGPLVTQVWNCQGLRKYGLAPGWTDVVDENLDSIGLRADRGDRSAPDLVGLVETWVREDNVWEERPLLQGRPRITLPATRGASETARDKGGLALFARNKQQDLRWEAGDLEHGAYLWGSVVAPAGLRVPGPRLFVCLTYLHPDPQKWRLCWDSVMESVAVFQQRGPVVLLGDMNAYVHRLPCYRPRPADVGPGWEGDEDEVGDTDTPPLERVSAEQDDFPADSRGTRLNTGCGDLNLVALNGRAPGDEEGALTTRTRQIDLGIVDEALWPNVLEFRVLQHLREPPPDRARALSDHAGLRLVLGVHANAEPAAPATPPPAQAPGAVHAHRLGPRPVLLAPETGKALAAALAPLADAPLVTIDSSKQDIDMATARLQALLVATAVSSGARLRSGGPRLPPRLATTGSRHLGSAPWATPALEEACRLRRAADKRVHRMQQTLRGLVADGPEEAQLQAQLAAATAERLTLRRRCKAEEQVAREAYRRRTARAIVDAIEQDPTRLWQQRRDQRACPCDPDTQRTHFEKVLNPTRAPLPPGQPQPPAPWPRREGLPTLDALNEPLTAQEVVDALQRLKLGKAGDAEGITAELLRGAGPEGDARVRPLAAALTPLLQAFLSSSFPATLTEAMLVPIFKGKGDVEAMDSYRGIALVTLLSKLYASLLATRLSSALEANGLRSNAQFGFRPGRGTTEAAFVLQATVDKHVGEGKRVYAAFVDFAKAFDAVPRSHLWARLSDLGVRGPFLQAVQLYYESVLFRVNTPEGLSAPFEAKAGVKQGCPLSPVLFGAFIEGLADVLEREAEATASRAPRVAGRRTPLLLYADDTTLLSLSRAGLQYLLDRLAAFCTAEGMVVNEAKTKIMVFRPGDKQPKDAVTVTYQGQQLETVESFTFLGIPMFADQRRAAVKAVELLVARALKAYGGMWTRARDLGVEDYPNLTRLFDACILSIAGYGCPLLAPSLPDLNLHEPDAAEAIQLRFLRAVLGVPRWTPKTMLYAETGRTPLRVVWLRRATDFVCKVAALEPEDLLHCALTMSLATPNSWARRLLRRVSTPIGQPSDLQGLGAPQQLADFVHLVSDHIQRRESEIRTVIWTTHHAGKSSMTTGRTYIAPLFPRHRDILGRAGPEAPEPPAEPASYLKVMHCIADRSLLAGLRMLPCVRGLNVGGSGHPQPQAQDDQDAPHAPPPEDASPCDVPQLRALCCPRCGRDHMSYAHALVCPGFELERGPARFNVNPAGLSLVGLLRQPDAASLGRLCSFVRLVRGLTADPSGRVRRVWRGNREGYPPMDIEDVTDAAQRPKARPAIRPPAGLQAALAAEAPPQALPRPVPAAPEPPGPEPKYEQRLVTQSKNLGIPVNLLAAAEKRFEDGRRHRWTEEETAYLWRCIDLVLQLNPDQKTWPTMGQCSAAMFEKGFLLPPHKIEVQLVSLRKNLKSEPATTARRKHLKDQAAAAERPAVGGP